MSGTAEIQGYSVGPVIGRGGLADVYAGTQWGTGRDVALKVLKDPLKDEAARLRFQSEVSAMAKLDQHPNIARIIEVSQTSLNLPVIVMDHYRQGSYAGRLARGVLRAREVTQLGVQMCAALESAHVYSVWHRDVKPANILIANDGTPKLSDFGIAAVASAGSAGFAAGWSPPFVPPEVLLAAEAGARLSSEQETQWDTYSLAVTLYALLSLRTPYEDPDGPNDSRDIAARVRSGQPMPLTPTMVPGAPTQLMDLLNRAISREVSQRPRRPSDLFLKLREIELAMGWPPTEYRTFGREGALPPGAGVITEVPDLSGPPAASAPAYAAPPAAGVYIEQPSRPAGAAVGSEGTELHTRTTTPDAAPARPSRRRGNAEPRSAESRGAERRTAGPRTADPHDDDAGDPARKGSRGKLLGIGAGVVAALALAGWAAGFLLTGTTPTMEPSSGPSVSAATVTPQAVVRPLPAASITSVREGDGVRFSWTYSDVQEGDWFSVVRTDVEAPTPVKVTEPNILIDDPDPCIEVRVIRRNGQGGPPVRACYS